MTINQTCPKINVFCHYLCDCRHIFFTCSVSIFSISSMIDFITISLYNCYLITYTYLVNTFSWCSLDFK